MSEKFEILGAEPLRAATHEEMRQARGLNDQEVRYRAWEQERQSEPEELELRTDREFEFQLETQHLRVVGYSVEEVADLLRLYREHMELIAAFAQQQQGLGDAYRSGPVQP